MRALGSFAQIGESDHVRCGTRDMFTTKLLKWRGLRMGYSTVCCSDSRRMFFETPMPCVLWHARVFRLTQLLHERCISLSPCAVNTTILVQNLLQTFLSESHTLGAKSHAVNRKQCSHPMPNSVCSAVPWFCTVLCLSVLADGIDAISNPPLAATNVTFGRARRIYFSPLFPDDARA